jgi:hypothetical protein
MVDFSVDYHSVTPAPLLSNKLKNNLRNNLENNPGKNLLLRLFLILTGDHWTFYHSTTLS